MFLLEIVFLLFVIAAAILLVQGVRKVPVQYAKRIVGNKQYGGARQYIPLKVNAANVMPIIFAQAIMFIPITLVGFSNAATASGIVRAFVDHTSFWYNFVFAVGVGGHRARQYVGRQGNADRHVWVHMQEGDEHGADDGGSTHARKAGAESGTHACEKCNNNREKQGHISVPPAGFRLNCD